MHSLAASQHILVFFHALLDPLCIYGGNMQANIYFQLGLIYLATLDLVFFHVVRQYNAIPSVCGSYDTQYTYPLIILKNLILLY